MIARFVRSTIAPVRGAMLAGIVSGIMIGLVLAPGSVLDWLYGAYDVAHPVARMSGRLIEHDAESALVDISGEKLRRCDYIGIRAYSSGGPIDRSSDINANLERVDRPEDGHTKPPGKYYIGRWRVWPVAGATLVEIYTTHLCDGRKVVTKVAEVRL